MPVYTCPDCATKLKRAEPLPAGKKLRCPECGAVFGPPQAQSKATVSKPAAVERASAADPDTYGLVKTESDGAEADARVDAAFSPIKDRFARSARGPALIHVVRPSDWLLRNGALVCIAAIAFALWAIWPLVFKIEIVQPEEKGKFRPAATEQRRFKELSDDEWRMRFVYLGCATAQFLWGAMICIGASKMHTLESYPLAMIGSVMGLIGAGVPAGIFLISDAIKDNEPYMVFISLLLLTLPGVPMAMWCVATLRKQEVIDGFAEEKPEEYVGDRVQL